MSLILIVSVFVGYLLYTPSGNKLLLPKLGIYFSNHFDNRIHVTVRDLNLSLPHFKISLFLDKNTIVNATGTVQPFKRSYDLTYKLIMPNIICQDTTLNKDIFLKGKASGTLDQGEFSGDGKIFNALSGSVIADVKLKNGVYSRPLKTASSDYQFKIFDLANLTKNSYRGAMKVLGKVYYHDGLKITGATESLGGFARFTYQNDNVVMKLTSLSAQKMLHMMHYPKMIGARVSGDIDFQLLKEKGNIDVRLKNIYILNPMVVHNFYKALRINLKRKRFDYGVFNANINQKKIVCNFKAQNRYSHIYLKNTLINQEESTINALFDLKLRNSKFTGRIYGDLYAPKVQSNLGQFLAFKMKKAMSAATDFSMKSKFDCARGLADTFFGGIFH